MFKEVLGFLGIGEKQGDEIKRRPPTIPNYKVAIVGGKSNLRRFVWSTMLQRPSPEDVDSQSHSSRVINSFEK